MAGGAGHFEMHAALGLADPTLGGIAAAAIDRVARVSPPRSWPDDRSRFDPRLTPSWIGEPKPLQGKTRAYRSASFATC
jgi:hypothetical protein